MPYVSLYISVQTTLAGTACEGNDDQSSSLARLDFAFKSSNLQESGCAEALPIKHAMFTSGCSRIVTQASPHIRSLSRCHTPGKVLENGRNDRTLNPFAWEQTRKANKTASKRSKARIFVSVNCSIFSERPVDLPPTQNVHSRPTQ